MKTISVIEVVSGRVVGIDAFSGDKKGEKEAEDNFIAKIGEQSGAPTGKELDECVSEGYWECGDYSINLAHSF